MLEDFTFLFKGVVFMTRSKKVWAAVALTALAVFATVPRASADFTLSPTVDRNTGVVYDPTAGTYSTTLTGGADERTLRVSPVVGV
jgi:hypothetical protein